MTFVFAERTGLGPDEKTRVIDIPAGLTTWEGLVRRLAQKLSLPEKSKVDWAGLCDGMREAAIAGIAKPILRHTDLPLSHNVRECRNYLRMLSSAGYDRCLLAEFPLAEKAEIVRLLSTHEPEKRQARLYRRVRFDANDFSHATDSYERLERDFPETTVGDDEPTRVYWINFDVPFNTMIDRSTLRDGEIVELFEEWEWFWCRARLLRVNDEEWNAAPIKGTFVYPDNVPNDGGPLKMAREYF